MVHPSIIGGILLFGTVLVLLHGWGRFREWLYWQRMSRRLGGYFDKGGER